MSAARRRNQVVIMESLSRGGKCATCISPTDVLRLCRRGLRLAFGEKSVAAVMLVMTAVMMCQLVTIESGVALGEAVARDVAATAPWWLVWLTRQMQKGGEA